MDIGTTGILSSLFYNVVNDDSTMTELVTADNNFNDFYKETAIENVKADIYNKFNVKVNVSDSKTECMIPRDVLYKMNSDAALREKIYTVLADYKKTKSITYGYNEIINNLLNGSYQGFETQQAMLAAQFLQRPKINLTQ